LVFPFAPADPTTNISETHQRGRNTGGAPRDPFHRGHEGEEDDPSVERVCHPESLVDLQEPIERGKRMWDNPKRLKKPTPLHLITRILDDVFELL